MSKNIEYIVLGGGCFWCLEAVYQRIRGVESVANGYSGGISEKPSYEEVCNGNTGHAEVAKVGFDTNLINLKTILQIFWAVHNPTTPNQQGNDIGTQYRSVVFYNDLSQKKVIEHSLKNDGQPLWQQPIVTQVKQLDKFWPAEANHQNYFNNNPEQAYCRAVINPKIIRIKQRFNQHLVNN